MPSDDQQVELREIGADDPVKGFSLGDKAHTPLKIFLQRNAKIYAEQMLAKSYGAFEGEKLLGYVTLLCGQIDIEGDEPSADLGEASYPFGEFPAVKIARLAVDYRYRGSGLGRSLIKFSLAIVRDEVASVVGCRFVVLDAKQQSVNFYTKNGFRTIDTESNKQRDIPIMYLDLKGIPDSST